MVKRVLQDMPVCDAGSPIGAVSIANWIEVNKNQITPNTDNRVRKPKRAPRESAPIGAVSIANWREIKKWCRLGDSNT